MSIDVGSVGGITPGTKPAAHSVPVTMASDQPDIAVSGTFTASGLTIAGRYTEVTINASTWTALPAVPLTKRNALGVQNFTGVEIKLQFDNTVPTYTGVVVKDGSERYYDITDSIVIYAKSSVGTLVVGVEELS